MKLWSRSVEIVNMAVFDLCVGKIVDGSVVTKGMSFIYNRWMAGELLTRRW
jgi:hypothetical protein